MIEAIVDDRAPYIDAKDGREALELVLAIYLSSLTGKAVSLPLNDVASIDFHSLFDKKS